MLITGWATDLKTVPTDLINSRVMRTGDGSHRSVTQIKDSMSHDENVSENNSFWGYGDKEMTAEDMKKITIIRKLHG